LEGDDRGLDGGVRMWEAGMRCLVCLYFEIVFSVDVQAYCLT